MQRFRETFQTTRNGTVVLFPLPTITVKLAGTDTLATIYSDNGVTTKSNPFTGSVTGEATFYAADGRYDVTASKAGFPDSALPDYLLDDSAARFSATDGASRIGFIGASPGAVATTLQARGRKIVHRSDYGTTGQCRVARGETGLFIDEVRGKLFGGNWSGLNYEDATEATMVWQTLQTADKGSNTLTPGVQFDFRMTGNGSVGESPPGNWVSTTIWTGFNVNTYKSGDGSGHAFTASGELGAVGPTGYNEWGGFQVLGTNTGSTNGNISCFEGVAADGGNPTKMLSVIARVNKAHAGTKLTGGFFYSSEGPQNPDFILGVNPGFGGSKVGLDLRNAVPDTGYIMAVPNATAIGAKNAAGTLKAILRTDSSNRVILSTMAPGAGTSIEVRDQDGSVNARFGTVAGAACWPALVGTTGNTVVLAAESNGADASLVAVPKGGGAFGWNVAAGYIVNSVTAASHMLTVLVGGQFYQLHAYKP